MDIKTRIIIITIEILILRIRLLIFFLLHLRYWYSRVLQFRKGHSRYCPKCGSKRIKYLPGDFSKEEILKLSVNIPLLRDDPNAFDYGYAEPGYYCTSCGQQVGRKIVFISGHQESDTDIEARFDVKLIDVEPYKVRTYEVLRYILNINASQALKLMKQQRPIISNGDIDEVTPLIRALRNAGAVVEVRKLN